MIPVNPVTFQYDERKNQINIHKYGISIPELATVFEDSEYSKSVVDVPDIEHSQFEDRYFAYGWTKHDDYVKIWYTYHGEDTIRTIGGREIK